MAALVLLLVAVAAHGYNLDTKFPVVYSGEPDSFFGLSVDLYGNDYDDSDIVPLVTAPKANSSFAERASLNQPGALYRCSERPNQCSEVALDKRGDTAGKFENDTYIEVKSDAFLGISLDSSSNGKIVTCGHLWKNRYKGDYFANGICYISENRLNGNAIKYLPLIKRANQIIIPPGKSMYAYGMAGFSASYTEDLLFLGAPGVNEWTGTLIRHVWLANKIETEIFNSEAISSENIYLGYSVTSGKFFGVDVMAAGGAPRDANDFGQVYIFVLNPSVSPGNKFTIYNKVKGYQVGEYFGASVLGIKIMKSNTDHLLVGAPLHSFCRNIKTACGEEGVVYVFKLKEGILTLEGKLSGLKIPNARFGTTLANIGDLNNDQFQDVAIGAPFENGKGAVYVYHGSRDGIKPKFVQRITPEDFPGTELIGFGLGLAGGKDVDANNSPDILIGAFGSDKAVLLKSHPVIRVIPSLSFNPDKIIMNVSMCKKGSIEVPCLNVTYCLIYKEKLVQQLDLAITLVMDSQKENKRGFFQGNTATIQESVSINVREPKCRTKKAYLLENVKDIISPIEFNLSYSLNKPEGGEFCKNCPILDKEYPNFITGKVGFWTGCGNDNICQANLNLSAAIPEYEEGQVLIIGSNTILTVEVTVQNIGEPAYVSEVIFKLPEDIRLKNQGMCSYSSTTPITLVCDVGNPLKNNEEAKITVKLDTTSLPLSAQNLTLQILATTKSNDIDLNNNNKTFVLPFKPQALIHMTGSSDREQVLFNGDKRPEEEEIPLIHTYNVKKYSNSNIMSVSVVIGVPVKISETSEEFLQNISFTKQDDIGNVPGNCTQPSYDKFIEENEYVEFIGGDLKSLPSSTVVKSVSKQSQRQKMGEMDRVGSIVLDCKSAKCIKFTCDFGPFLNNVDFASITMNATVNGTVLLNEVGSKEIIGIRSQGRATVNDDAYQDQLDQIVVSAIASTSLVKPGPPMPQQVEIWVIVLSIIAGILLLAAILLVLAKLGFFQRLNKEELEKAREEKLIENNEKTEVPTENKNSD